MARALPPEKSPGAKNRNPIIEFTENFSGFIGFIKIANLKIIIRKNSEIPLKFVQFVELYLSFLSKKSVHIFENLFHFLRLWIVLKNGTSPPSGALAPFGPAAGGVGRVIASKWPACPPQINGDASVCTN